MKIKSILDCITNSSSEVYLIKTNETKKELKKWIESNFDYDKNNFSGMGGEHSILEDKNLYFGLLPGYFLVNIDWASKDFLERFKKKYPDAECIDSPETPEFDKMCKELEEQLKKKIDSGNFTEQDLERYNRVIKFNDEDKE